MIKANVPSYIPQGLVACALSCAAMIPAAHAQVKVANSFSMPVRVQAAASMSSCANAPGPQITLTGDVSLGGMNVVLTFQNNVIGTHSYTVQNAVSVVAVASGATITIPKQPVLGGVGGNPFIWVQMVDGNGAALGSQVFLGRCVQGPFGIDASVNAAVNVAAQFTAQDCSNNPGPYITMDGALSFATGVKARFTLANADNPVGGPHEAVATVDVALLPSGTTVQFPKQPVLGGVGGNPWIYAQFEQADGTAIGSETLLGRCVQLAPGN